MQELDSKFENIDKLIVESIELSNSIKTELTQELERHLACIKEQQSNLEKVFDALIILNQKLNLLAGESNL